MARILYFARLVDELGRASEEIEIPASGVTVRALLMRLRTRGGPWALHLQEERVRVTVNKRFAELDTKLADSDEIAFVPVKP